ICILYTIDCSCYSRKRELKRQRDQRIQNTRVNIGVAFPRWKVLMKEKDFQRDAEVAGFLLDRSCLVASLSSSC
uniref:Uncharacterized protein n=1 Tax=Sander lucioperca TaxID=283035 RepID=A0A8D0D886_SANLU